MQSLEISSACELHAYPYFRIFPILRFRYCMVSPMMILRQGRLPTTWRSNKSDFAFHHLMSILIEPSYTVLLGSRSCLSWQSLFFQYSTLICYFTRNGYFISITNRLDQSFMIMTSILPYWEYLTKALVYPCCGGFSKISSGFSNSTNLPSS